MYIARCNAKYFISASFMYTFIAPSTNAIWRNKSTLALFLTSPLHVIHIRITLWSLHVIQLLFSWKMVFIARLKRSVRRRRRRLCEAHVAYRGNEQSEC